MSPSTVQKNKVVSLTYTLRNERGDVFEYSDLPVAYVHGAGGDLFEKIEHALEGHKVGERVVVRLSPAEGFGPHDPKLTFSDDVENVPPELRRVGAQLEAENARGERLTLTVTAIDDTRLTVDANHPLAGQTVTFEVTIEDVRDATADELRQGRANAPVTQLQ
jgi:FKBP-type peptidyl-prolyl cis-trans isomerase SlyD